MACGMRSVDQGLDEDFKCLSLVAELRTWPRSPFNIWMLAVLFCLI